jgi:hypothetical protein
MTLRKVDIPVAGVRIAGVVAAELHVELEPDERIVSVETLDDDRGGYSTWRVWIVRDERST